MGPLSQCLYDQVFTTPAYPTTDCTGRTIIVTGANTGLGKEAVRHLVRLNADRVILTSRTASKGEAAAKEIEETTGRKGVVEVWDLDLQNYDNVKAFAGISTMKFTEAAGNESTITVNVVSTFLLALLVLPKLQETARLFNVVPTLTIVSSDVHYFTSVSIIERSVF
jgi:retinol dehydrogenase-12